MRALPRGLHPTLACARSRKLMVFRTRFALFETIILIYDFMNST